MPVPKPTERKYLRRILIVGAMMLLPFTLTLGRYYLLQLKNRDAYVRYAEGLHRKTVTITPLRGSIYSSHGFPLASSNYSEIPYLAPSKFNDDAKKAHRAALKLGRCLGVDAALLEKKIVKGNDFSLVGKHKLEESKASELMAACSELELPSNSLYFVKEGRRNYPQGTLAAHVVGMTRPDKYGDNEGVSGAEATFDKQIAGENFVKKIDSDVTATQLSSVEEEALRRAAGNNVFLTLNEGIQLYTQAALKSQVEKVKAKAGVCIVQEIGTGEVLAMASYPDYDLNRPGVTDDDKTKLVNRCLMHAISPGSVMKVFTTTALLESKKLSLSETIDCHGGSISYPLGHNRFYKIKDSHELGVVPVIKAFAESSNVAYTLLGQRIEKEPYYEMLRRFGFGRPTGFDLRGESSGILHPVDKWTAVSRIAISIGYEITATALQISSAMAAIANDGQYVKPHILKEIRSSGGELLYKAEPELAQKVCSPETTRALLGMMEQVVLKGTGKKAAVPGYRVGGKTGTTRKHDDPKEERDVPAYYSSFIGVLPLEAPRLVIYTWIDEPKNEKFGGDVAAPIFRMVAEHAMRVLNIEPTLPLNLGKPVNDEDTSRPVENLIAEAPRVTPMLPRQESEGGVLMPDLSGRTVKEVVEELGRLKIDGDLLGSGIVVQQLPAATEPVSHGDRVVIVFGAKKQF